MMLMTYPLSVAYLVAILLCVCVSGVATAHGSDDWEWWPYLPKPAPDDATPQQIRDDVISWLRLQDLTGARISVDPAGYGERAIPVIREILENPDNYSRKEISGAISLLIRLDVESDVIPMIEPYLLSDDAILRRTATRAISRTGREGVGATLISMIYDPERSVRALAFPGLAEYGGADELRALRIWYRNVEAADDHRDERDKWLRPEMEKAYQKIVERIEQRIEEEAAAEGK